MGVLPPVNHQGNPHDVGLAIGRAFGRKRAVQEGSTPAAAPAPPPVQADDLAEPAVDTVSPSGADEALDDGEDGWGLNLSAVPAPSRASAPAPRAAQPAPKRRTLGQLREELGETAPEPVRAVTEAPLSGAGLAAAILRRVRGS